MFKKISGVAIAALPLSAFAAVPQEVTTALTDMKSDTLTVATAFVVLAIVVAALMWMRKPAR